MGQSCYGLYIFGLLSKQHIEWYLFGQEGHDWLAKTALKVPKIEIVEFRKIKGSCISGNDKCISTF